MQYIKFAKNWNNKLGCEVFSTIRKADGHKREWYASGHKKVWQIIQSDVVVGYARLEELVFLPEHELSRELKILDTGILDDDERVRLWQKLGIVPEEEVAFLIFRWVNWREGEGYG